MNQSEQESGALHGTPGGDKHIRTPYLDLSFARNTNSTANAALFLAIAGIILCLVLFFFGRSHDIPEQVKKAEAKLAGQIQAVDQRLAALEGAPDELRRAILAGQLREMNAVGEIIGQELQTDQAKQKMTQVRQLLKEIESTLATAK